MKFLASGVVIMTACSAAAVHAETGEPSAADIGVGLMGSVPWGRPSLTGDWGGARADWGARGFTFGMDVTNIYQDVVDGGRDEEGENMGVYYLEAQLNTEKAGLWPGGFVDFRLEGGYGDSVSKNTGTFLGVNNLALFPEPGYTDPIVSKFMLTQFFSARFGIAVGRTDTLDGDGNQFSAGRGKTQFMNPNLLWSPTSARTTPYILNAASAIAVLDSPFAKGVPSTLTLTVGDATVDVADVFGDWDDYFVALGYKTFSRFGGKPGSLEVSWAYNSVNVVSLADLPRPPDLEGVLENSGGSWNIFFNMHQYLWVKEGQDPAGGFAPNTPMLQGMGFFIKGGMGDDETNPIDWDVSAGLAGRGLIPGRHNDTWGLGLYHVKVSDNLEFLQGRLDVRPGAGGIADLLRDGLIQKDVEGFEAWYNIELAPWLHLTLDYQFVEPPLKFIDDSHVLGMRLKVDVF